MERGKSEILLKLIQELQAGADSEKVKAEFASELGEISEQDLAEAEGQLIKSGVSVSQIQSMCDIHARVYLDSQKRRAQMASQEKVTPLFVLQTENQGIKNVAAYLRQALQEGKTPETEAKVQKGLKILKDLGEHYSQKETLFFPYLYRHGISAPAQVMWENDDRIRAELKEAKAAAAEPLSAASQEKISKLLDSVEMMITKENEILCPLLAKTLTPQEMSEISAEMPRVGYAFLARGPKKEEFASYIPQGEEKPAEKGKVALPTGSLTPMEIDAIFNALPCELTFIGADNIFRYFNLPEDRIFLRTKAQLNEEVTHCHPAQAIPAVEKILTDLASGKKDRVEIPVNGILNSYVALKDTSGKYLGCLEISRRMKEKAAE
jgi:DUF438 domain-containing protein